MRTYMAIIAAITMLATTAALGQGGAAAPTGVDKTIAYGYPAANEVQIAWATQNRTDLKTVNSLQTSATVSAPVVLIDSRGGSGMHRGGGSFRGGSSHGKSFHSQPFHGGSSHGKSFHGGFHRDFGSHGHHSFHHRNNDFNLRFGFGYNPYRYGYSPYRYYYPSGSYPYGYYPYGSYSYGSYPYGYYYGNPVYSYPYFSCSW